MSYEVFKEKLTTIAENEPKVFEAGKKKQYDEFWDTLQANGAFKSYQYAFGGALWSDTTFKPKYNLNGTSFFRCFAESTIKTIDKTIDLSRVTGSTSMQNMFNNAKIETISNFYVSENTTFHNTAFNGCTSLKHFNITGTIGKNNLSLHDSTYLSATSILAIFQACNKTAAGVTVTLPSKCIDNKTTTETYITGDTILNTAFTLAKNNGYTFTFA